MSKRVLLATFLSGLIFATGLGISGMTQPSKVIGFLDLFGGRWDPSLILVMASAIAVHLPLSRWIRSRANARVVVGSCGPIADEHTDSGSVGRASAGVIAGAAIFGIGWGLGGYCPGPALVSLVSAAPGALVFVGAMLIGMTAFHAASRMAPRLDGARRRSHAPDSASTAAS